MKDRAKQLPEAMYAAWKAVSVAVGFWTSPARGSTRLVVHPSAFEGGEQRTFLRVDDWGPDDDSRGRCLQSWQAPASRDPILLAGSAGILQSIRRRTVPCREQCKAVLQHFFREHDVDDELTDWTDMWEAEKRYADAFGIRQQGRRTRRTRQPDPEPLVGLEDEPDYDEEVGFQVYATFKLGPGTSEVGDSSIYTRTVKKDNSWFRFTSYVNSEYEESDNNLDYKATLLPANCQRANSPEAMMWEVRGCH